MYLIAIHQAQWIEQCVGFVNTQNDVNVNQRASVMRWDRNDTIDLITTEVWMCHCLLQTSWQD